MDRRQRFLAITVCILIVVPLGASAGYGDTEPSARITIDARRTAGTISPRLYGQFLEYMFEGIKGGLHAELIRNRGFEEPANAIGLSRDWERYPDHRNDDYGIEFAWSRIESYPERTSNGASPGHSLRVVARDGVIPRHGVFQGRVPVREGVEYHGYLWLKTTGYQGRILVALESDVLGGDVYAETPIDNVRGGWTKYPFHLRPRKSDPLARFVLVFEGRGRVWVDQVSLLPGDAIDGVRRDAFDRVKALRPAFIRWPGGNVAQDYHWKWGVGPRDERFVWSNLAWRNEPEPSDFGTDEFISLCRGVGAEPSITVNVEGGGATPEEAASWVEYCNGPARSPSGSLRAANGHVEPFRVTLWEVGNEVYGDWVRGHSDATTYAKNYLRYARAMRAVDPSIKLIAVGHNDLAWNRDVLRVAGQEIDYLAIHHYYGRHQMEGDLLNLLAHPLHYERFYRKMAQELRELAPGRPIQLAINEWGLDLPVDRQYAIEAGLYGARLMNVFERAGDLVGMSAVSDLVNGWPGGIIQAGRHGVFVTPIYLVNQLYSEHLGKDRLDAEVVSPTFHSSREGRDIPYLDAAASRSADGRRIFLKVVNTDMLHAMTTQVRLSGVDVAPRGKIAVVRASAPGAKNGFATPDAIAIERADLDAGSSFQVVLPSASVAVLTLDVAR